MSGLRTLHACLVTLCLLLFSSGALAQRVILVRPSAPDPVLAEAFTRLRAELGLQGFETGVVELNSPSQSPAELSRLAQENDAFAAISLSRGADRAAADICIADRVTGKTTLRSLALDRARDAPSVLAIRAADLLRASLRELSERPPPPDVVGVDARPAPDVVKHWVEKPRARFRLEARGAALGIAQDLGTGVAPALAFGYRPLPALELGLLAAGPAVGASLETEQGSASVRQELALAHGFFDALAHPQVELGPVLAAGVYHLNARGAVDPPLSPRSSNVTSFAAGLGLAARLHLGSALFLSSEVTALLLAPRPAVAVLDDVARFRLPFVLASAGVGVAF